MKSYATSIVLVLALASSAWAETPEETRCRKNLTDLAEAISSYKTAHDGKLPPKLSDLYYQSYADDVTTYRCPSVGGERLKRTEIDEQSDYTLDPIVGQKGIVIRERAAHHGDKAVLAAFEDGSIKLVPLGEQKAAADSHGPTDPGSAQSGTGHVGRNATPTGGAPAKRGGDEPTFNQTGGNGGVRVVPGGFSDGPPIDLPPGAKFSGGASRPAELPERRQGSLEDTDRQRLSANTIRGPLPPQVALNIADTVYKEGGYDAALDFYEKVLAEDPRNQQALLGHARASFRTGSLKVARQDALKVLEADPHQAEARRISATVDLVHGELKRAAEITDALAKENPGDADTALLAAQVALFAGNDASAKERFDDIAKSNPKLAAELRKLADFYRDEQLIKLAMLHYASAAALAPSDQDALLGLGLAAAEVGDKPRAIRALNEYLKRHTANDPDAAHARSALQSVGSK